jgi:hypothetical protein
MKNLRHSTNSLAPKRNQDPALTEAAAVEAGAIAGISSK